MKIVLSMVLVSISMAVSAGSAFADTTVSCKSALNQNGGGVYLTLTLQSDGQIVLKGTQSGGMAQFVREIGPYDLKETSEADGENYFNTDKIDLNLVTTGIAGNIFNTATFKEGVFPAISLNCSPL